MKLHLYENNIHDENIMLKLCDSLNRYLKDNNVWHYADVDWKPNTITIDISWGDWKHDHIRVDYYVEQFMNEHNYKLLDKWKNITEEDGSDTYSATHYYTVSFK